MRIIKVSENSFTIEGMTLGDLIAIDNVFTQFTQARSLTETEKDLLWDVRQRLDKERV